MIPAQNAEDSGLVLHKIFEATVHSFPDNLAVVFGSQTITYAELDARANQLAGYLRSKGIERGATVAMCLPRSIEAYAAILGILKAGAAYVPIDPCCPPDRVTFILEDSGADAVLTVADLESPELARQSSAALPRDERSATARDLCYLIYTSGSTGRPKGVMVEHRNVCHLVRAEGQVFGVNAGDRVYQGASLSFDLSVEEIWLAFSTGAALVGATPEMTQAGPDLARYLAAHGITVMSCVPTLLSMVDGKLFDAETTDLPALRLLILGGEPCPPRIVERWSRPWRRVVNTYGPTETTVIATYADVFPDKPITIGRALPGYHIDILDDRLQPVPPGRVGEICIGGAGVARGYRGRPEETRARFIGDGQARLFRSGDMGRLDSDGNIEFAGRTDGQVKLRGLRIELGEIEAVLLRDEEVRAAACVLCEGAGGDPRLVAWIVPRDGSTLERADEQAANRLHEERLVSHLRNWLPAWMVPSVIEFVEELPRLPSGKLDRARLSARKLSAGIAPARRLKQPRVARASLTERRLTEVWNELFHPMQVSPDDDFFLDLGGHSLLAARMVSEMREDAAFSSLTVRDVYTHPTISRLAAGIDSRVRPDLKPHAPDKTKRLHSFWCGVAQTASLYFVFGFRSLQWLTPYLVFFLLLRNHSAVRSAGWALAAEFTVLPLLILVVICAKWILLGEVRPGHHPLWSGYYARWWFVQTLVQSLPLARLGGTPLLPFVYRLFGVKIDARTHIASDLIAAFDVISIGAGASIDEGASLLGYTVEEGHLVIAPVSIGGDCVVGTRSVLCPGAVMEDGARLEDLSLLSAGERIPSGETWFGSPARRHKGADPRPVMRQEAVTGPGIVALYVFLILCFPLIELAAFLPGVFILMRFNPAQGMFYLTAPVAGACFILCVTAEVVLLKWLLIGRARAGRYPVHGSFYIRNWIVEQLLAFSIDVAGPLRSTLFLKPWYRLLGARLGRFVEFSTATTTTPDLLDIGDDCTIADDVSLGAARVEYGWLTLAPTKLGRRVFVGNGAVIPAGTTLGAGSLVGVLTIAPENREQAARHGACWLGSPPILLERRQPPAGFAEQTTFRPSRKVQWARACWEVLRITLPGAGFALASVGTLEAVLKLWDRWSPAAALLSLPAIFAAACAAVILAVVPVKWMVTGRYRPFEAPLWSAFLWRLEFVNALFEFLAGPIGLETLRGTPLLPWYLKLLGCKIGRGTYIDSLGFLEFDLVEVGDRAVLNKDCILQTHLFEDRVMKGSWLRIGSDCEIGQQAIALYDSEMKDGARLGNLSLLMKGEVLPAGPLWIGSPLDSCMGIENVAADLVA